MNITSEARSRMMRRVTKRNSKPEVLVRSLLHKMGYRFVLHRRDLPGTPDIVMPRWRVVILVHGCFWHQHQGCRHATRPRANIAYWEPKLARNVTRDQRVREELEVMGWRVLIVRECETKKPEELACRLAREVLSNEHAR